MSTSTKVAPNSNLSSNLPTVNPNPVRTSTNSFSHHSQSLPHCQTPSPLLAQSSCSLQTHLQHSFTLSSFYFGPTFLFSIYSHFSLLPLHCCCQVFALILV